MSETAVTTEGDRAQISGQVQNVGDAVAAVILLSVIILWSGWRYLGPRGAKIAFGVGGLSGLAGGACGLPGPPVIIYWMASRLEAIAVRANTMVYLYLGDLAMGVGMFAAGILTLDTVIMAIGTMPFYLAGLLAGARLFDRASEAAYRRIAFLIILTAALTSLPLFDGLLR